MAVTVFRYAFVDAGLGGGSDSPALASRFRKGRSQEEIDAPSPGLLRCSRRAAGKKKPGRLLPRSNNDKRRMVTRLQSNSRVP
ncbi:hypothetical protein [Burkholderia gladioli]|uniref:hypothetical protein n=1 Tax=Burkholderia gladioli TaxID=28095 RepID=UPI00301AF034